MLVSCIGGDQGGSEEQRELVREWDMLVLNNWLIVGNKDKKYHQYT